MCTHEDDAIMHEVAIMHEPQASALCNQVNYCIIRVCHIKRRKLSWACHNCFIAGHMISDQPDTNCRHRSATSVWDSIMLSQWLAFIETGGMVSRMGLKN